ncbi:MAG TPA: transglycosylase domain-containing protein, partial [Saprospiraceae bacterium]|nr:transglycosylase domain-containing protein [Saprospiraceae bacterium]
MPTHTRQKAISTLRKLPKRAGERLVALARRRPVTLAFCLLLLALWLFCLPRPLFDKPVSVVVEDRNGELLGARIATDGQWRFPQNDSVPEKYAVCVVAFEDKRFWWHPGVDPLSLGRSLWLNIKEKRVVSGGSTLTMQVIRLMRDNPPRTVWQKALEIFMATRLELTRSKRTILSLYASNAPFGGNVVGLEAASWRYFGKRPGLLTWAESATLAVLPNSPGLIHPGRNRNTLLGKRNRLLEKLRDTGRLSAIECDLSKEEPLPDEPLPLPQLAPHLLDRLTVDGGRYTVDGTRYTADGTRQTVDDGKQTGSAAHPVPSTVDRVPSTVHRFKTTVDIDLQRRIIEILHRRQAIYKGNGVHNMAAVVLDVPTGEVLAYVGNVSDAGKEHGESVDIIAAPRSTGSILKPYLYALALESGDILPKSLLHDVPTQLGRYRPENFYESYDGMVPARRALIRSLNVPFVLLLQQYGLEKFHFNLQRLGLTTLNYPPEHYGLSLILGGAEANLLDITNVYACMARELGSFYDRDGRYAADDFRPPRFIRPESPITNHQSLLTTNHQILSAGAIWHTFEAMQEVERPNSAGEWEYFAASRPIAWKTGTSFGFRDAGAAGVTPRYAVGIWVGNADGEGRPGLIGVEMAAPVLFEI